MAAEAAKSTVEAARRTKDEEAAKALCDAAKFLRAHALATTHVVDSEAMTSDVILSGVMGGAKLTSDPHNVS